MVAKEAYVYSQQNWQFAKSQLHQAIDSKEHDILVGIDGPVAVGKGWIAQELADIFDYLQISNGNAVRAFTWFYIHYCSELNLMDGSFQHYVDDMEVLELTENNQDIIRLKFRGKSQDLNPKGLDKALGLRSPEIEEIITTISSLDAVVGQVRQRNKNGARLAQKNKKPIVFEGRDNYETLREFPHALRIYLTADNRILLERAVMRENNRRASLKPPQLPLTEEEVLLLEKSTETRNAQDMNQPYGQGKLLSLAEARDEPGYKILDTTDLSKDQARYAVVVAQLLHLDITPETEHVRVTSIDQPTQPSLF